MQIEKMFIIKIYKKFLLFVFLMLFVAILVAVIRIFFNLILFRLFVAAIPAHSCHKKFRQRELSELGISAVIGPI